MRFPNFSWASPFGLPFGKKWAVAAFIFSVIALLVVIAGEIAGIADRSYYSGLVIVPVF